MARYNNLCAGCSKVQSYFTQSTIKVQLRNTNKLKNKVRKYNGNLSSISVQQVTFNQSDIHPRTVLSEGHYGECLHRPLR